jgi:hypothetical protein
MDVSTDKRNIFGSGEYSPKENLFLRIIIFVKQNFITNKSFLENQLSKEITTKIC